MAEIIQHGFSAGSDVVIFVFRVLLGVFFVSDRFRWFYDPSRPDDLWFNAKRREHLEWKLGTCGYGTHPFLAGFVAHTEFFGGLGVIVGFLTPVAALGLLGVLLFASYCTAREKTLKQGPVDDIDVVSDYLWLVEPLYTAIALSLLLVGAGAFSVDHYFWSGSPLLQNELLFAMFGSGIVVVATLLIFEPTTTKHSAHPEPGTPEHAAVIQAKKERSGA